MKPSGVSYLPLSQTAMINENTAFDVSSSRRICAFYSLVISNVVLFIALGVVLLSPVHNPKTRATPTGYAEVDELPTMYKSFTWWTEYSGKNDTEVNALWDAILPSHGLVAVNNKWATERHWPESMNLPGDNSKSIYLLEAYHQLHCVKIIRQTFWEAIDRKPYTYNPPHSGHCFDFLRQSIQCNADNTPLYSFGDYTAGDGQLRKCKDWNALREWATENTACYRDSVDPISIEDHFGYCDGGTDGMITGDQISHADTVAGNQS